MVQTAESAWQLRYLTDAIPPTPADLADLRNRLHDRLEVSQGVELLATDFLLPENSGKFRLSYPLPVAE
jgi:hypothetical protein